MSAETGFDAAFAVPGRLCTEPAGMCARDRQDETTRASPPTGHVLACTFGFTSLRAPLRSCQVHTAQDPAHVLDVTPPSAPAPAAKRLCPGRWEAYWYYPHLFANVVVSEEKARAEVLLGHVICVDDDELADAGEDDVLDSFGGDTLESDDENRRVAHPVASPKQRSVP